MREPFYFIWRRPRLAAALSALCLLDAANCVRLGHDDWWFPTVFAFGLALLVRTPTTDEGRGT